MKLIGINGFKRSGKDTTYLIISELQPNVARAAFADKLKIMAARALGYVDSTDEESIALMDEAKESWLFSVAKLPPTYNSTADIWTAGEVVTKFTGRQYLQWFGGEARKVFGGAFWIDQVLPSTAQYDAEDKSDRYDELLEARYPGVETLCVTDVRYPNEARRVLALGGTVLEVVRPGLESDGHSSETPLPRDLVTHTINNDGSLDDLRDRVMDLLVTI